MNVGDALPTHTVAVKAGPMKVLSEVLRDPNPIHLDPAAAAAAGLGDRVINQGPANLAYVIDMLAAALPNYRLAAIDSRYLANVRDGDRVTAGGTVTSLADDGACCDVWLRIEGGQTAVTATATLKPR